MATNNDRLCACAQQAFAVNDWSWRCESEARLDLDPLMSCLPWEYIACTCRRCVCLGTAARFLMLATAGTEAPDMVEGVFSCASNNALHLRTKCDMCMPAYSTTSAVYVARG